jgi:thiamine kinase-like enzyme
VRELLRAGGRTRDLADAALTPLPGGFSNHAWRADCGGRRYFVRLGRGCVDRLGVDRGSERVLIELAAAAGIAPPVVACDPAHGLLVTNFIDGRTWTRADAQDTRNIVRLGERLRALHGLAAPAGLAPRSFDASAALLEAQLCAPGRDLAPLRRAGRSALARLGARSRLAVPCHDDLHHLNLVDDGERLWLVDWEYGGAGDPAYDLASYVCQHDLDADGRRRLIVASGLECAGDASVDDEVLSAACIAFDYVQWLWYRVEAARVGDAEAHHARADLIAARTLGSR